MSGVAGRSGRKAFVPNSEQRHIVKTLTGLGLPQKHICRLVTNPQTGKPLDPKSLRKHFALEIGIGARGPLGMDFTHVPKCALERHYQRPLPPLQIDRSPGTA